MAIESLGATYQLNSAANSAHLAHFCGEAKLAVLFSWYVAPKRPHGFEFFYCHGGRLFN